MTPILRHLHDHEPDFPSGVHRGTLRRGHGHNSATLRQIDSLSAVHRIADRDNVRGPTFPINLSRRISRKKENGSGENSFI